METLMCLVQRLDSDVRCELIEENLLKLYKRVNNRQQQPLAFSPSVFILVRGQDQQEVAEDKASQEELDMLTMTYNEEILERQTLLRSELSDLGKASLIVQRLNTPHKFCTGLHLMPEADLDLASILIERYGQHVTVRSRKCSRVLLSSFPLPSHSLSERCVACTAAEMQAATAAGKESEEGLKEDGVEVEGGLEKMEDEDDDKVADEDAAQGFFVPDLYLGEDPATSPPPLQGSSGRSPRRQRRSVPMTSATKKRSSTGSVSCEICGEAFRLKRALKAHQAERHIVSPEDSHAPNKEQSVRCPVTGCERRFRLFLNKRMRDHLVQAHAGQPECLELLGLDLASPSTTSTCPSCPELTFTSSKDLVAHVRRCRKSFTCELCGQVCVTASTLKVHKRNIHSEDFFFCSEPGCGKKVKTKASLLDHIACVHKNEKMYMCSGCGKNFRYRHQRRMCENKHQGKFIHPCSVCDKKFNDKRRYEQHMRVHTGEKPFACPICTFRCARMDNLNLHTKKNHGLNWKEAEGMTGVPCRSQPGDRDEPAVAHGVVVGGGGNSSVLFIRPQHNQHSEEVVVHHQQHHHLILLDTKSDSFKIVTATAASSSAAAASSS